MPPFALIFLTERLGVVRVVPQSIDPGRSEAAKNDECSDWMLIFGSALAMQFN
jgi:hypothetical protein